MPQGSTTANTAANQRRDSACACQLFTFRSAGGGAWTIRNVNSNSNLNLDIRNSSSTAGAAVVQWNSLSLTTSSGRSSASTDQTKGRDDQHPACRARGPSRGARQLCPARPPLALHDVRRGLLSAKWIWAAASSTSQWVDRLRHPPPAHGHRRVRRRHGGLPVDFTFQGRPGGVSATPPSAPSLPNQTPTGPPGLTPSPPPPAVPSVCASPSSASPRRTRPPRTACSSPRRR
ncbi:RICIN domain-containing protein [Streptomyces sp. NBC_00024]